MTALWLPGVNALPSSGGGSMAGGPSRKALWHRTIGGTFKSNATYLASIGNEPHILWDPRTGELGQFIPANRSSKALKNKPGGVETNRVGTLCVQIEVVDRGETFVITDTPMLGGDRLMAWLRSLGIPDVMPGGPFPPLGKTAHVSSQMWNLSSGHFSHSQTPENDHTDPGPMDPARLFALGQTPAPPAALEDDMPTPAELWAEEIHDPARGIDHQPARVLLANASFMAQNAAVGIGALQAAVTALADAHSDPTLTGAAVLDLIGKKVDAALNGATINLKES